MLTMMLGDTACSTADNDGCTLPACRRYGMAAPLCLQLALKRELQPELGAEKFGQSSARAIFGSR